RPEAAIVVEHEARLDFVAIHASHRTSIEKVLIGWPESLYLGDREAASWPSRIGIGQPCTKRMPVMQDGHYRIGRGWS
ncbi:MAG: hypothetical protein ACK4OP_15565, partial [Gemmobacter sp.]